MITLITGVPGSGKTLYALNYIKGFAEKTKRKVFQSGIKDLTLPWTLFGEPNGDSEKLHETDATNWNELPKKSIIVIDECQRLFRPRGNSAAVPEYVAQLETHRHKGYDIFLITQHPMLIDSNIRRLVGQHFHVIRRFGTQRAVVHEFSACSEITQANIASAVRHDFRYPVEAFTWYKSAEAHTHKRRIPMRMFFMWAAPVIIAGLVYVGYTRVHHLFEPKLTDVASSVAGKKGTAGAVGSAAPQRSGTGEPLSTAEYLKVRTPRIHGLAYTAPIYDELTKPTRAPVPGACVQSPTRCQCYTQDGTALDTDVDMCKAIVQRGFFKDFDEAKTEAKAVKATPTPVKP